MTSTALVVNTVCSFEHDIQQQCQHLPLQLQLKAQGPEPQEPQEQEASLNTSSSWQYCPKKQAQLRDEALAKILLRGNKAGYTDYLRLGQEVLARDSKKTGYFPARLVVKDSSTSKRPPQNHIRIHYDGRPEGEYRDIPDSYVYYLPKDDNNDHNSKEHSHVLLLSPWVLLDEMHNFEMTPLLAYSKVFERTEFRKFRVLYDGTVFEVMDKLGRIVKVKSEWIHQHSTAHPDAIQEAVAAAAAHAQQQDQQNQHHPKKEQFFDLIYGASHKNRSGRSGTAIGGACTNRSVSTTGSSSLSVALSQPMLRTEESSTPASSAAAVSVPRIQYGHQNDQSDWLPAAFASAIHIYAEDYGHQRLKECARTIYQRGKSLKVDSKLRHNFVDMVNRCVSPIGYKMEALQFFNLLHQCPQAGSAPVVACIFPPQQGGGGFGKWVSCYQSWVLDPTNPYATQRTPDGLSILYGKGDYNSHAIVSWSYCLVPLRTQLVKQRQRNNNSNSSSRPINPNRSLQNHNHHHHHHHRQPNHHNQQQERRGDDAAIANHSNSSSNFSLGESQGLFKKKCRSRKRSRSSNGRNKNFASSAAASNRTSSSSKRAR